MTSFFNVPSLNPFTTAVGQKIESATDGALASENWAMYMEVCDMINESTDNSRDAMKAIRKRLQQNAGKNYTVVMYTLVLLETCVKNCGRSFHSLVASKDFIQDLVKMIGPKNEPPAVVQDKVLGLIQVWAETFRSQPDLSGVVQIYQELKNKGMEFPAPEIESIVPIYTPQRSVPAAPAVNPVPVSCSPRHGTQTTQHPSAVAHHQPQQQTQQQQPGAHMMQMGGGAVAGVGPFTLVGDQLTKIQSELDIVTVNMTILSDMLSQLVPGQETEGDYQMLTALTETCREMQGRIVELIGKVTNDEITAELLRINDELNNLFLRHARYEKNRGPQQGVGGPTASPSAILGSAMGVPGAGRESSLIDLGDNNGGGADLAAKLSGMDLKPTNVSKIESVPGKIGTSSGGGGNVDEFDLLAQSRTTTEGGVGAGGGGGATLKKDSELMAKETEFDEMAAWLKNNSEDGAAAGGAEDSLTSTEFDRFLAERAAAAENLPTISRDEKALLGEVNAGSTEAIKEEELQEDDEAAGGSASSISVVANERRNMDSREKKPKSPQTDDSLIQF